MILFGCGGHARSVISVIRETSREEILLVDENVCPNERILGCRTIKEYRLQPDDKCMIAIGNIQKRKKIYELLSDTEKMQLGNVHALSALIKEEVFMGKGIFIAANAYVGPQAVIGDNTIINTAAVIEHEVRIGQHVHIAPNATICGRAKIGNEVFCGASSTIIDKVSVCDKVTIGAGAVVTDDIIEPGIYVGVPARKIKE